MDLAAAHRLRAAEDRLRPRAVACHAAGPVGWRVAISFGNFVEVDCLGLQQNLQESALTFYLQLLRNRQIGCRQLPFLFHPFMHVESGPLAQSKNMFNPAPQAAPLRIEPAPKDTLGCMSSHLQRDQGLCANGVGIHRKTMALPHLHHVETEPSARGVLLGISMRDGHSRRIVAGRHASCHDFDRGSIYIRGFSERYRADIQRPFDFVLLEISQASLERAIEEKPGKRIGSLAHVAGARDEVLLNLAEALTPALENPACASMLFVEQLSVAMTSYLVETYGGAASSAPRTNRILSRSHEARAKEMLRSKFDGSISITEIADACGLSRSYFIHAFRETTGCTPHQWLIAQRLEHARALLMNPGTSLADIAAACGFADQSHFSRVFSQHSGVPPGIWRRRMRVEN
ncbi:helix-turn-helix transcriptional regulator [Variovorax sp. CCNWLW235]|uniref:helix-turn-helix transcriptional regulator n=1 Tax=Variovorax sp. CCNWLW235 TaxID=3127463 RepID=UPI003076B786